MSKKIGLAYRGGALLKFREKKWQNPQNIDIPASFLYNLEETSGTKVNLRSKKAIVETAWVGLTPEEQEQYRELHRQDIIERQEEISSKLDEVDEKLSEYEGKKKLSKKALAEYEKLQKDKNDLESAYTVIEALEVMPYVNEPIEEVNVVNYADPETIQLNKDLARQKIEYIQKAQELAQQSAERYDQITEQQLQTEADKLQLKKDKVKLIEDKQKESRLLDLVAQEKAKQAYQKFLTDTIDLYKSKTGVTKHGDFETYAQIRDIEKVKIPHSNFATDVKERYKRGLLDYLGIAKIISTSSDPSETLRKLALKLPEADRKAIVKKAIEIQASHLKAQSPFFQVLGNKIDRDTKKQIADLNLEEIDKLAGGIIMKGYNKNSDGHKQEVMAVSKATKTPLDKVHKKMLDDKKEKLKFYLKIFQKILKQNLGDVNLIEEEIKKHVSEKDIQGYIDFLKSKLK